MIKAFVFDLDDTLYNEIDYVKSGFFEVSKYLEKNYGIVDAYNKLIILFEESRKNVYNRLLDAENIIYSDKDINILVDLYRNHNPKLVLSENVRHTLMLIKELGYKTGIITDGRVEGQWKKIKALGLEKYFDAIIVSDELGGVEYRKPDKRVFFEMANRLGIQTNEMVYIGDNPCKDFMISESLPILTIRLMNTNSIYYNEQYKGNIKPKILIDNISEVLNIINL